MKSALTTREINDVSSQQIFTLERKIHKGEFSIESVGNHLPGNVLVTDLSRFTTIYMNNRGCNILKHSAEELEELGPEYYQRFFVPEEISVIVRYYEGMLQRQSPSDIYNFVHRVKVPDDSSYKWYFASAKLMYTPGQTISDKMLLVVNEVNSAGSIANKINSVLDESDWIKRTLKNSAGSLREKKKLSRYWQMARTERIYRIF